MTTPTLTGKKRFRAELFARWPVFDEAERTGLNEVLESGVWGGYSAKVKEFEEAFAAFHQSRFAVSASNGTVTLEAALIGAGIGAGDEVIVPPITFVATAAAVVRVGATPVFADIGRDYNLDARRVAEAVTERTRAMIPVHFAGRPADMEALGEVAAKNGVTIIEDAAHAHGAAWNGRPVGNFGRMASFSFQQSKNVTAGEGGILIGSDEELIERVRSIFNQGRVRGGAWYEHHNLGTNQRMTGWQAAVLLAQMARLPSQLERRAENARYLDGELAKLSFIEPMAADARVTRHGHYLYPIRLRLGELRGLTRADVTRALSESGVPGVGSYPYPLYDNAVFEKYPFRKLDCPEAEGSCRDTFWVSHEVLLAGQDGLEAFIDAVKQAAG